MGGRAYHQHPRIYAMHKWNLIIPRAAALQQPVLVLPPTSYWLNLQLITHHFTVRCGRIDRFLKQNRIFFVYTVTRFTQPTSGDRTSATLSRTPPELDPV